MEDVARQVDAFSDPDVMKFKKLFAISGRDVTKPVHVLEATFDFAIVAKKEAEEGSMFDIPQVTRADTMRELSHQMEEKYGRKATGFTTLNENTSGTVRAQEDAPRRDSGGNPSQDDARGSGDDQKDAQTQAEERDLSVAKQQNTTFSKTIEAKDNGSAEHGVVCSGREQSFQATGKESLAVFEENAQVGIALQKPTH